MDKNGGVEGAKLPDLPSQHEMDSYMLGLQRYERGGREEREGTVTGNRRRGGGGGHTPKTLNSGDGGTVINKKKHKKKETVPAEPCI